MTRDEFVELAAGVVDGPGLPWSLDHGVEHWRMVASTGLRLIELGADADAELVLLFALFHDSWRLSEYGDPDHGARGASLALTALDGRIERDRLTVLLDACALHEKGFVSAEPTTAVCWDADRLNLWRVGIVPRPAFLSTDVARANLRLVYEPRDEDWSDLAWGELAHRAGLEIAV